MKRKGFILYADYLEPILRLEDAEAGKLQESYSAIRK